MGRLIRAVARWVAIVLLAVWITAGVLIVFYPA